MAENYKHLYEQTKKMLTMYQDELIPGFRKQIEELEANLSEREKVVIQLRKQWQDAEMHICTMCGHFDCKTDGNIVYVNQTCGEICGYPFCKEKFTRWIPVTERLPEDWCPVLVVLRDIKKPLVGSYRDNTWFWEKFGTPFINGAVTHWMPLPEPPKEERQ